MSRKRKMTKDTVPEDFSVSLALVDALPVVFFCLACIILGISLVSPVFIIGALITFVSGVIKVLWKIIVAVKKKNVWWMFIQMRIAMPLGFAVMIAGFIIKAVTSDLSSFWNSLNNIPSIVCFFLGGLGMVMMMVFAFTLDSSSSRSNWTEQLCNGLSQMFIFIGLLVSLF